VQTRAAWTRIDAILREADLNLSHVIMTNNILTDWRYYEDFNAGYGGSIAAPYPPRLAAIAALPERHALIQIEALAHRHADNATILDAERKCRIVSTNDC
jgi:enamine deaminase RidA (YjgF/YER057c/UK114 family)